MTLIETRKIDKSKVRHTCIHMNWYTLGTNQDYMEMLTQADRLEATPENIYQIAKDIYNHSDMSNYLRDYTEDEVVENIMCYIVNDATISTIEIKRA